MLENNTYACVYISIYRHLSTYKIHTVCVRIYKYRMCMYTYTVYTYTANIYILYISEQKTIKGSKISCESQISS